MLVGWLSTLLEVVVGKESVLVLVLVLLLSCVVLVVCGGPNGCDDVLEPSWDVVVTGSGPKLWEKLEL